MRGEDKSGTAVEQGRLDNGQLHQTERQNEEGKSALSLTLMLIDVFFSILHLCKIL